MISYSKSLSNTSCYTGQTHRVVRLFDSKRVACLATDWFKKGIDFWLLQKYSTYEIVTTVCCSMGWNIVFTGSRFTHPAESKYAPIEEEALAVVYGLLFARHFLPSCDILLLATDNKLQLGVLNNMHLGDIKNGRLLSLKEGTLPYRFSTIHIPEQKQKASGGNSWKLTGDTIKFPWIPISKRWTPSLVLNRVSVNLRPS